jgi:AcrR family transcriptional regulator
MASTRDRLIDRAELVFARDGFERASLREIMRLADANPSAVHYHFGGKQGLLAAVLDRAVGPIGPRRMAGLERLRDTTPVGPLPVRGLVEAFLRPDFEAIAELQARGPERAALIGRAYGQPTDEVRALMYRQFDPVARVYFPAFEAALAPIDPEVVRWRLRWCLVGVIVSLFANADLADGPIDPTDPEVAILRTTDFLTAGLEAPMS